MTIAPIALDLQSNPGRHGPDGGGRLINAYPESAGDLAKGRFPVYPIAGLASFATISGGGVTRGAITVGDYGYFVSGTKVVRVDGDGNVTDVGTFPGAKPVFMAANRATNQEIMIVSDGFRYLVDTSTEPPTVATIADADLPGANSCTHVSGYFIASISDGRFFISSIDDGTAWDANDNAEAETQSDDLLVAYGRSGEVALFGANSIEFWLHTGDATFPFEINQAATVRNLGVLCPYAVRDINDVVFFIASDGTVRMLNGYSPQRISHHAVERDIRAVSDKNTITATAYADGGHQFVNFSSATWTWTFDALTGQWHERLSYNATRWRGEGFAEVGTARKKIIGDYAAGTLYQLDNDTHDEAGNHLIYTVKTAPIHDYPNEVVVDRMFVDTIPGVGLNASDDTADPKLMMRYSRDGGKTWTNERTATLGKIGKFRKRVVFDSLGQTGEDGMLVELSVSAAVVRGITQVSADVELVPA